MLGKIVSPRLEKLEKDFLDSGGEWRNVRIGDIFEKLSTKFLGKGDKFKVASKVKTEEYNIPLVYAKSGDNGIMYWGKKGDFETHSNVISIIYNGAIAAGLVYAQPQETGILAESYLIKLKDYKVDFKVNLFLKNVLEKVLYPKYSREYLATWGKVENDYIVLPFLNGEIYFSYMEKYIEELEALRIEELEALRIEELEAYLVATGLKDYHLTKYDEEILDKFNRLSEKSSDRQTDKIRLVNITNLFDVRSNPQLNKDSFKFSQTAEYPYFTRTVLNNGIAGYVEYLDEEHKIKGNSIAVGMLGMKFFYMEKDFYAGQFTKTIFPKYGKFSKEIGLYFITEFNKKEKLLKSVLVRDFEKEFKTIDLLLYHQNNDIDYEFIRDFIKVIEKLVIKDVVIWAEKKIEATRKVVCR